MLWDGPPEMYVYDVYHGSRSNQTLRRGMCRAWDTLTSYSIVQEHWFEIKVGLGMNRFHRK